jgi:hemerythrin-like domain-containing protein
VNALEVLLEEHIVIVNVISVFNKAKNNLKNSKSVPKETLLKALDMIINFADKCHHGKEENVLFPLIKELDPRETSLITLLLEEHQKGRMYVRNLGEAINKNITNDVIENIEGYATLLAQHIKKENAVFPKWINPLSNKEKEELFERFEEIEEKVIGLGKHQEYMQNIEILRKSL